ncbi:MAG: ergothioneine biosynthesis protein EgtB [Candidatus Kapaibacterium sp.]|nr:MAG: ergothioneine biosynthesis protein EgtB [Candidatus Kapabacteria bacterium]
MTTPHTIPSNTASIFDTQAQLQQDYNNVRAATLELCMPLQIEDYVIQTAPFMSPPRWHLGHTAWFFEMLLTRFMPEYRIHSEEYLFYFNSYYEGFGKRINRQKRGAVSRPTVQETMLYRSRIDGHMNILIERIPTHPDAPEIMRLLRLGLEHEMQHQELLVYDIKHLLANQYVPSEQATMPKSAVSVEGEVEFAGGLMQLGTNAADHLFAWDNECPRHTTFVNPFALDKRLVTNAEFLEFMRSGGYADYRWWLSAAWEWLRSEGIDAPMYWERTEDGANAEKAVWNIRDYRGLRSADNNEPVTHISYYEAAAFAKWRGKRLPSEAEWEFAAMQHDSAMAKNAFPWGNAPVEADHANLFENKLWCCSEAGSFAASPQGMYQLIGDAWEWTSSDYAPYPGFTTQFDEYNDKWFVNQKVLRGASYATPRMSVRSTYRNFFAPSDRWMVSGFRCARTLAG